MAAQIEQRHEAHFSYAVLMNQSWQLFIKNQTKAAKMSDIVEFGREESLVLVQQENIP